MEETVLWNKPNPCIHRLQSEHSSHESLLEGKAVQVLNSGDEALYFKSVSVVQQFESVPKYPRGLLKTEFLVPL